MSDREERKKRNYELEDNRTNSEDQANEVRGSDHLSCLSDSIGREEKLKVEMRFVHGAKFLPSFTLRLELIGKEYGTWIPRFFFDLWRIRKFSDAVLGAVLTDEPHFDLWEKAVISMA